MSDLTGFRDHARRMATATHTPDCTTLQPTRWGGTRTVHPDPTCPGCITDTNRALWVRLADEADNYLDRHQDTPLEGTA